MDSWDYFGSERVISEVKQHPCLYDPKHGDFKNKDVRRSVWRTIASNMLEEHWDGMDERTKADAEKEVQKRWKSIRDCYTKYIKVKEKEEKMGNVTKCKKPYVYHKRLSFLRNLGNVSEEGCDESTNTMDVSEDETRNEPIVVIEADPNTSRLAKEWKADHFAQELTHVYMNGLEATPEHSTYRIHDPDEMFLLSQLPVIKQLSQFDKLDFQIKFIQLLQSYYKPSSSNTAMNTGNL